MDVRLLDAAPTTEEREAVDACLGPPTSAWDGGARGSMRDAHVAHGGADMRARRHELLPALRALQGKSIALLRDAKGRLVVRPGPDKDIGG